MKCQPVRCWPRRNGFARVGSWNWLKVSETDMIKVSLRVTCVATAGAAVGFGASVAAGLAISVGFVGAAVAGAPVGVSVGPAGTGNSCGWHAPPGAAGAP